MHHYAMILHECDGTTTDVGVSDTAYRDLDEARAAAFEIARSIMIHEISQGKLCLTCWIIIKNEEGHTVMTIPFGDAIELRDHPPRNAAPEPATVG